MTVQCSAAASAAARSADVTVRHSDVTAGVTLRYVTSSRVADVFLRAADAVAKQQQTTQSQTSRFAPINQSEIFRVVMNFKLCCLVHAIHYDYT